MLRQFLRPIVRNIGQRGSRSYHETVPYKPPTMDEMVKPEGPWQEYYDARQKKYNMHLAIGVVYAAATFAYIVATDAIYLNWAPPVPKDKK